MSTTGAQTAAATPAPGAPLSAPSSAPVAVPHPLLGTLPTEGVAVAAIDIGSNSIHLTLARVRPDGRIETIARLKDPARLAGALDADEYLSEVAIDRAVATLGRFRSLADVHRAVVRATATAALRAARNADVFIARAKAEAGVEVVRISGHLEARLTWLGVCHGLPDLAMRPALAVDVGGGSTELVCGCGPQVRFAASVPVGSLVTTRKWLGTLPITPRMVRAARAALAERLAPSLKVARSTGYEQAVATSGSAQRIARIARALETGHASARDVHGMKLSVAAVRAVVDRLCAAGNSNARLTVPGMDPERADTLLAGALIFEALATGLGIDTWTVSMSALRTGLLIDTARSAPPPGAPRL